MKLTNYAPTVQPNTISGRGNPVSNPSDPRAWGADVSGINALGNAVGIGLKMAEDDMTADVTKAMNEYNRRMDDLMFNQENGLAYLKNENARNVTQLYQEGEKKIRDEVFKMVPKYKKAQDLFIQKANASTIAGIEDTQKQAYREHQNYKMAVMNDTIETSQIVISHNYTKPQFVQNELSNIRNVILANGKDYGPQWCKDKIEEVMGKTVGNTLSQAFADNDMQSVDNLVNRFGPLVNPAYIRQFVARNNQQKEQNFMITQSQQLAQQFRKDPKGLRDAISKMQIDEPSTGNWGAQIANNLVDNYQNKASRLDEIGGTTCVYWPTVAAHELNPDIPVMTSTTQLKEFGREKGIWYAGPDAIKNLQPGDMIILNSPNEAEAHNTVWVGNGIYNSGGAEDAYVRSVPQTAEGIAGYFGDGWSIAGVVSLSQLQGGGMGPAKKRALSPAEQQKLYAATLREINILDAQDKKIKLDSFNGYKEEAANMAAQGIYDIQQYLEVARRYDGVNGLTMADLVPVANAFASGGARIAGVSINGTRSQKQEKADWAEAVIAKNWNRKQAEEVLIAAGIPRGTSEFKSRMNEWAALQSSDIDVDALKQRWSDEGHKAGDFKAAFPYALNGLISLKEEGKRPTQQDAWNLLLEGETTHRLWTSRGVYDTKMNRIYNVTGAYSHNEQNGLSYIEGRNEDSPLKLYDDEIYDMTGGVAVEEDN